MKGDYMKWLINAFWVVVGWLIVFLCTWATFYTVAGK